MLISERIFRVKEFRKVCVEKGWEDLIKTIDIILEELSEVVI